MVEPTQGPVREGDLVRAKRTRAQITLRAAASHLGLSVVRLSDIERNRVTPNDREREGLAALVGAAPLYCVSCRDTGRVHELDWRVMDFKWRPCSQCQEASNG